MLRSTVSELHPAVLSQGGLARALRDLADATARPDLAIDLDLDDWPDGLRTPTDGLLFGAARELLSNVVKHAGARRARVSLAIAGDQARLVVADDGHGVPESPRGPGQGHVGLYTQRLRVEAAGGALAVDATGAGTTATVTVALVTAAARHPAGDNVPGHPN
jgi:two-component system NarL family sensor kinase